MELEIKISGQVNEIGDNENGVPRILFTSKGDEDIEIPTTREFLSSLNLGELIYKKAVLKISNETE